MSPLQANISMTLESLTCVNGELDVSPTKRTALATCATTDAIEAVTAKI